MADPIQDRLKRLEWLVEVAIDRLTAQPGPMDQGFMVLRARLSEAEADFVMDTIASLEARVGTNNAPTRDEILNALGDMRPTGIGSGPEHFVGELLEAFGATKLLPIWKPQTAPPQPVTVAGVGSGGGPPSSP